VIETVEKEVTKLTKRKRFNRMGETTTVREAWQKNTSSRPEKAHFMGNTSCLLYTSDAADE